MAIQNRPQPKFNPVNQKPRQSLLDMDKKEIMKLIKDMLAKYTNSSVLGKSDEVQDELIKFAILNHDTVVVKVLDVISAPYVTNDGLGMTPGFIQFYIVAKLKDGKLVPTSVK